MDTVRQRRRVVVLGLGNTMRRDDGLGVRALERLVAQYELPQEVDVVVGGVRGLALLPRLAGATHALIVDAVRAGREPGAIVRLEGDDVPVPRTGALSAHDVGPVELLFFARLQGSLPSHVVVWGMEPATVEPGSALSSEVAGRLDELVRALAEELRRWGVEVRERDRPRR